MAELMLVNPRRKRRRKMSAKQAKYFGPRRKRAASVNPRRRRKRRAVAVNPRRRRRRAVRANPYVNPRRKRRSHSRRARRNPLSIGRSFGSIGSVLKGTVLPAAIGAAGALGLDVLYSYLPIPAQYKSGAFAAPVKIAAVLAAGMLAEKVRVLPSNVVRQAVAASVTIQAYNWLRSKLSSAGVPGLAAYVDGIGYTGSAISLPDYTGMSGGANEWSAHDAEYNDLVF